MQEAADELLAQQLENHQEEMNGAFDMLVRRAPVTVQQIAPQPQVTVAEYEATKDLRCLFCPHPTDPFPNPPQLPLADAPWTTFRCGCRIHTVCFALFLSVNEMHRGRNCPCCGQQIITPEQRAFLSQRENRPEERKESRLEKLWKEDEAFREELKEVAKEGRKVGPLKKVFEHDRHILRQEWKEAIMPGVTLIRNQKQIFTKRFIGLESRKKYFSIYNRYKLKLFRFLRTYDLDQHQFARRSVKGIPRLHHATRWGLWRCKAWHVFRVRL